MMGKPTSARLLVYALAIAILALVGNDLRRRGLLPNSIGFGLFWALALANLAVATGGLRTRHRLAWGGYLVASVATLLLLGFSTPIGALVVLAPMAADLGLSHASGRP